MIKIAESRCPYCRSANVDLGKYESIKSPATWDGNTEVHQLYSRNAGLSSGYSNVRVCSDCGGQWTDD